MFYYKWKIKKDFLKLFQSHINIKKILLFQKFNYSTINKRKNGDISLKKY